VARNLPIVTTNRLTFNAIRLDGQFGYVLCNVYYWSYIVNDDIDDGDDGSEDNDDRMMGIVQRKTTREILIDPLIRLARNKL